MCGWRNKYGLQSSTAKLVPLNTPGIGESCPFVAALLCMPFTYCTQVVVKLNSGILDMDRIAVTRL
jgi:hypothetical protein